MKRVRLFLAVLVATAVVVWPTGHTTTPAVHIGQQPTLTLPDLRPHLEAFEQIAQAHGGHRGHGSPGYAASVAYVEQKLIAAGFKTHRQQFTWNRDDGINLIADWPGGDPNDTLMIGAHLDSVARGPGINDNGSGSAMVLALALAVAATGHRPQRHLRFAWWGAEELGLIGSAHYIRMLTPESTKQIRGYLNVDMIASPNGGHFVYNSDNPIERALMSYFTARSIPTYAIPYEGRSDYAMFLRAGVPVGGVITGTREIKTEQFAAWWGGTAGAPFDPCYHQACDTNANINETVYLHSSNATAHAFWTLSHGPWEAH
ncbi:M28 family peptidase [Allorhizocola rhizosphaerae]|uniref:M28 family peptidase n=1 Tax=Allorhizocola rhizosphaerae TaxID=1872709 RepID=UPI000E3B9799|nr:M28 family peptidase [Allorhizocola rhizosphaerae]